MYNVCYFYCTDLGSKKHEITTGLTSSGLWDQQVLPPIRNTLSSTSQININGHLSWCLVLIQNTLHTPHDVMVEAHTTIYYCSSFQTVCVPWWQTCTGSTTGQQSHQTLWPGRKQIGTLAQEKWTGRFQACLVMYWCKQLMWENSIIVASFLIPVL